MTIAILYRAAIAAEIDRMAELARSQARLIESVARFDSIHSVADHPEGATMATLGQVAEGHAAWLRRDSSLDILVAWKRPEGQMALVHQGQVLAVGHRDIPNTVSKTALDLSLLGKQGGLLTAQMDGREVIAGYDFIPVLQFGIVLQVPLSKLQRPFVQAVAYSAGVAIFIALMGAIVFRRASLPLVEQLRRELRERRAAEAELARHQAGLEGVIVDRTIQLERAQDDLVKAEKLATLGRILATVSHELRNPLGTLRNSLFSLSQRTQGHELGLEPILARAQRSSDRCNTIIDELLTFTRVRSPKKEIVDIGAWLKGFLGENDPAATHVIDLNIAEAWQILVDIEDLRRCFHNLIANSTHAIAAGAPPHAGCITISAVESGKTLIVSVHDNGVGIPTEVLPRVFDPLFSTKSFGVGLGLSIVRDAAIRNGGTMSIESTEGLGTTVFIQFPIHQRAAVV